MIDKAREIECRQALPATVFNVASLFKTKEFAR